MYSQILYFMKKARMLLSAIAVFAIVGGAYAFKAQRVTDSIWVRVAGTTTCGLQIAQRSLLPQVANQVRLGHIYATDIRGICPDMVDYYTAP